MADEEEGNVLEYLDNLQDENKKLKAKNTEYEAHISNTSFQNQTDSNLIQWQVNTDDILDMIEHFLKGDVQVTENENTFYTSPTKILRDEKGQIVKDKKGEEIIVIDEDLIILNSYGVNSLMHILGNYINRNTTLSFYDEDRINEILADLGDELNKFIMCNYEKMGMTTNFKKSKYEIVVLTILHSMESAYRKALGGQTMQEINRNTNVIQSENLGQMRMNTIPKRKFNLLNPKTW